jgi:hypothetical protein
MATGFHVYIQSRGEPIIAISFQSDSPMSLPLTLTFRHLPRSGALEASARDVGDRLQRLNDRMTACHIVFEGIPEAAGGVPFRVRIHVSVPGAQIHAESVRQPEEGQTVPHSPLRSAYENAKRQLAKLKQSYGRPNLAGR